ncbi:hypothetical protein J4461_03675 [Candidatus Pacearchaeota archaeon]|nr:hypothetical protein [uncultured archaeon]AQS34027.1 hypothetical protein [uncultured archaeon]AQS34076.1 hypothetical protein [uncultured archaeon]MBS3089950.1 hypothetical protein [Candidatus Pacearchaeota archaeon]
MSNKKLKIFNALAISALSLGISCSSKPESPVIQDPHSDFYYTNRDDFYLASPTPAQLSDFSTNLGVSAQRTNTNTVYTPLLEQDYSTEWNVKDLFDGVVPSTQAKYNIESAVFDGENYVFMHSSTPYTLSNEMNMVAARFKDVSLFFDDERKELLPGMSSLFVFEKVLNDEGKPVRWIFLSKEGPDGIEVERKDFNLGIDGLKDGILTLSERDLGYSLRTKRINERNFYVPELDRGATNLSARWKYSGLNRLFIPVRGTQRVILPDNSLAYHTKDSVYWGREITMEEYSKRGSKEFPIILNNARFASPIPERKHKDSEMERNYK